MKRFICLIGFAALLTGCGEQVSVVNTSGPFNIAKVEAYGPPPSESSDAQLRDLRNQTAALAARVPKTDNPLLLRLRILSFHKKNAGLSLLVGDSNNMEVSGEILSLDGTTPMGTSAVSIKQDFAINGILGAAIAAGSTTNEVERRLDAEAANAVLERIYGTKTWKVWSKTR